MNDNSTEQTVKALKTILLSWRFKMKDYSWRQFQAVEWWQKYTYNRLTVENILKWLWMCLLWPLILLMSTICVKDIFSNNQNIDPI